MKNAALSLALILCPLAAAQQAAPLPENVQPADILPAQPTTTPVAPPAEVTPPTTEAEEEAPTLPPGEARIRAGIVLLGMLHDTLAKIQDTDSAELAVPAIMKLARELQSWGQGFTALPPLDEATQSEYEKRYLPIVNKINERIRLQAERIAAAEFYGSENLPAALVRLVNSVQ